MFILTGVPHWERPAILYAYSDAALETEHSKHRSALPHKQRDLRFARQLDCGWMGVLGCPHDHSDILTAYRVVRIGGLGCTPIP